MSSLNCLLASIVYAIINDILLVVGMLNMYIILPKVHSKLRRPHVRIVDAGPPSRHVR